MNKILKKPIEITHRPIVNCGGKPQYGGVTLYVYPADLPTEVILACEDNGKWFSFIKQGIEDHLFIDNIRIEVRYIYWHPVDTNGEYMRRIGADAIKNVINSLPFWTETE